MTSHTTMLRCDCQEWTGDEALGKEIEAGFIFRCPKCRGDIREVVSDDEVSHAR